MTAATRARRGMALWVVLVVACFLFLLVANLTMLSHGEMHQLARSETFIRIDVATRSIYEELVAPLRTGPWERRPFRSGAVSRTDAAADGVRYSCLVEDTRGVDRSADIWISATRDGVKRVVFHRIAVRDSVFQKMNRVECIFFGRFDPDRYGQSGSIPLLRDRVDSILQERARKEDEKNALASRVQADGDFGRIMSLLGLPVTGAQPLLVQSPFSPDSRAGYDGNPALLSLAGADLTAALGKGKLSLESFQVVQGADRSAADRDLLARLAARSGERAAGSILDKINRLALDPAADPGLFAAGTATGAPAASPLEALDRLLAGLPPVDGDPAASGADDADRPIEEPSGTGGGGEPDTGLAPDPSDGDPAVSPGDPGTDPAADPTDTAGSDDPAATEPSAGGKVYTFDELISTRDIYDDDFVSRYDGKKGLFGVRRSVAAYTYEKEAKYALLNLMNKGKAEMADFERFIRSLNTLERYSIVGHMKNNYERERQKVAKVARDYFKARAGAPVGPDGAAKL